MMGLQGIVYEKETSLEVRVVLSLCVLALQPLMVVFISNPL